MTAIWTIHMVKGMNDMGLAVHLQ